MKRLLFFLFVALRASASFAQEPLAEMNDRATLSTCCEKAVNGSSHFFSVEKVVYSRNQSLYNNTGERITQRLLLCSGDREIMDLAVKAGKNRKLEFIAFAAVPLGLASALCIRQNQLNSQWIKPAGIACLAASLSCMVASPLATHRKTRCYKKAVRLYNLHF